MKGHEKLDQKMLYFLVYHYFWGHLAILKDVECYIALNILDPKSRYIYTLAKADDRNISYKVSSNLKKSN